jgi:hypothetical protein
MASSPQDSVSAEARKRARAFRLTCPKAVSTLLSCAGFVRFILFGPLARHRTMRSATPPQPPLLQVVVEGAEIKTHHAKRFARLFPYVLVLRRLARCTRCSWRDPARSGANTGTTATAAVTEGVTYQRRLALLTTRAHSALRERLVAAEDTPCLRPADESSLAFGGHPTSLTGVMERISTACEGKQRHGDHSSYLRSQPTAAQSHGEPP